MDTWHSMSQAVLFPVTDQIVTRPCNRRIILPGLYRTTKASQTLLNEARLAMLRLGLSIYFHHQMALVPSLAFEVPGQESQNGRRLFRAEMDHVGPAVRKRNRQIFIRGYHIIRVVLLPPAFWSCGIESRLGTWLSASWECCVLSGRGLCDGPIPRPEDSGRVCTCHWVCIRCNSKPLHLQWVGRRG